MFGTRIRSECTFLIGCLANVVELFKERFAFLSKPTVNDSYRLIVMYAMHQNDFEAAKELT